jgi:Protein of unknown function (DUF3999)
MKKIASLCIVFVLIGVCSHAQFKYQRKLEEIKAEGWYALPISENVLTKLNDSFSDIRIYSPDETEMPYLLKISHDEVTSEEIALETYNVSKKENDLYFSIKLADSQAINHASINLVEENYDTYVNIEGSNDEKEWFQIAKDQRIISIADKNIRYNSSTIYWSLSKFIYLRFKIANAKSLSLSSVNFSLSKTKLGTFRMTNHNFATSTKNKVTQLTVAFPATQYISKLLIEPEPNQKFYRNYQIEALTDSFKTEKGWQRNYATLQTGVVTSFKRDTISISPTLCSNLLITIYNEDNPAIKVKSITTWSPEVSLVASLTNGNYTMKYGNEKIGTANYDLTHFANEIPTEVPKINIGDEETLSTSEAKAVQPWFKNKNWLWAIMLGIVGLLGFFTVRMLRKA